MNSCTPWTLRLEKVLSQIGIDHAGRRAIQAHQAVRCNPQPRSPRPSLSVRCQNVLTHWGVTAQDQYQAAAYIDELTARWLGPLGETPDEEQKRMAQEEKKKVTNKRQQQRREAGRDTYNTYQKVYMQAYRAKKKAQKAHHTAQTAAARAARWPAKDV